MRFELDDDTVLLRDTIRDFARAHLADGAGQSDQDRALPATLAVALAQQGLLGLQAHEDRGGSQLDELTALLLIDQLAQAHAAVGFAVVVHNLLAMRALAQADHAMQASCASGEVGLLGWAEPQDAAASMHAHTSADGFALQGAVARVATADAQHIVVCAQLDGQEPLEGFVVPAGASGLSVQRHATLGLRAAQLGHLACEDVRVPAQARLGPVPWATRAWQLGIAAVATGVGAAALGQGTDYAQQREQFGQPIARFQAIQWKLANLATGLDTARLLLQAAAATAQHPSAAAKAAIKATEVARDGASDTLQIHGGYGYTREFPVERLLRDARQCGVYVGAATHARTVVADAITQRFAH